MHQTQEIRRGTYGELILADNNPLIDAGRKLLHEAILKRYIEKPFFNRYHESLNYDLCDANRNEALVQIRDTRYQECLGSPPDSFFVIQRRVNDILIFHIPAKDTDIVLDQCKSTKVLGDVLETLNRKFEESPPHPKCLMVAKIAELNRLQSVSSNLPVWRTKDSTSFSCSGFWSFFEIFGSRDRLIRAIRDDGKYQDATRKEKRLAIIEITPRGQVFTSNDSEMFRVSAVRYIRQIEMIQSATLATCETGA